jgi:hypothetical protein
VGRAEVFTGPEQPAISDWVDDQLESGASATSIRHRHGLLSGILKHGQTRLPLRPDNPAHSPNSPI